MGGVARAAVVQHRGATAAVLARIEELLAAGGRE
jgi:hypothetical protein